MHNVRIIHIQLVWVLLCHFKMVFQARLCSDNAYKRNYILTKFYSFKTVQFRAVKSLTVQLIKLTRYPLKASDGFDMTSMTEHIHHSSVGETIALL